MRDVSSHFSAYHMHAQLRRCAGQTDSLKLPDVQQKYAQHEKKYAEANIRLTEEYKRITEHFKDLQAKFSHFQQADLNKYQAVSPCLLERFINPTYIILSTPAAGLGWDTSEF